MQVGRNVGRIVFLIAFGLAALVAPLFALRGAEVRVDEVRPASGSRVFPIGKLPADSRLGPLNTLNGYFPFTAPKSREQWDDRADQVRKQMLVALGLWPMPEKTPLNAVVHGKVEREGYTVERVYFESYPGHFVTGNLYRPKEHGEKVPGVLCPYGHFAGGRFAETPADRFQEMLAQGAEKFESGKFLVQAYPAQLARMGCVVLQYDMVGYADSVQIPYEIAHNYTQQRPQLDTKEDWGFYSTQADLHLQSIMGLQTYNSIRALDFLTSLPEVDAQRIGVAGASSGGTQALMLCAIDPRPTVAVPAVMVSTAMQGGCTCENCNLLRIDTGNVEFAGMFAPKPLEAIAANDWTKEIETKGGPELTELYALLGARDNFKIAPFLQFPHNFNSVSRGAMYSWINKQLKLELREPIVEEDFVPLTKAEGSVWDEQHPAPKAGEDYERGLMRQMTQDSQRQLAKLLPKDAKAWREFRYTVRPAWAAIIGRRLSNIADVEFQQVGETATHEKYLEKKGLLRYKPKGEEVPLIILQPPGETRRTAIWLDPAGKAGLFGGDGLPHPGVRRLLENGVQVVGIDLLYQGEFLPGGEPLAKTRQVKNNNNSAAYTFGYNRAVFAQRVHDVLTAVTYFRGDDKTWGSVDLIGLNGAGHWAAAAKAMAMDAVDRTVIDTGGFRFADVPSTDHPDFLPGGAKYFDMPGLLALCAPGETWIRDPASESERPKITVACFEAADARKNLHWQPAGADSSTAAIDWLLKK